MASFQSIQLDIIKYQHGKQPQSETLLHNIVIDKYSIKCINIKNITDELYSISRFALVKIANQKSINDVQKKQFEIFKKKNGDYGNSYQSTGLIGILVRMIDKLKRIEQLQTREAEIVSETIEDTWLDLSIYSILAIMIVKNDSN